MSGNLHLEEGHDGVLFCYRLLVLPSGARIPMAMSKSDADALAAVFAVRDAAKEWRGHACAWVPPKTAEDANAWECVEDELMVALFAAVDALGGETP